MTLTLLNMMAVICFYVNTVTVVQTPSGIINLHSSMIFFPIICVHVSSSEEKYESIQDRTT